MSNKLYILYDNRAIAQLTSDTADNFNLTYEEEWKQTGFPISPNLPLSGDFSQKDVKNFILNLLPEGAGLDKLSELCQISKANHFGLLNAIGKETSGALSFGMEAAIETSFRKVSIEELTERILERKKTPITLWDEKIRLSLAGVQEKLPIAILNGEFGFGEGNLASTHILKFSNNANLVFNEHLSLEVARAAGLNVNNTKIQYFKDEPVLIVERFDRKVSADNDYVKKLHIIDGCQLLSMPPSYKYEHNFGSSRDVKDIREGVSFKKLFAARKHMATPLIYVQALIEWTLVNLCLGNSDAHGKNISFFVRSSGNLQLTPFYDIVNVTLYDEYDIKLAMGIGDQFEIMDISAYDLAYYCHLLNLKEKLLITIFEKVRKKILNKLESKDFDAFKYENDYFYNSFKDNILARMEYLSGSINDLKTSDFSGYF